MPKRDIILISLAALIALVVVGLVGNSFFPNDGRLGDLAIDQAPPAQKDVPKSNDPSDGYVRIGGVDRPISDVEGKPLKTQEINLHKPVLDIGHTPYIKKDKNVYTKSVAEAIEDTTGDKAYRLTPYLSAPKFDRAQYAKNPDSYLNEVVPGRIYDVLPSTKKNPTISRVGNALFQILQGESAKLQAKTEPGMPVTFYSGKFGQFNDGLSVITVAADNEGIAAVNFKTTPGMFGDVDIVATSPVRSGKARYIVQIALPDDKIRVQ